MKPFENIAGKGENAGNQHFLSFLQCFPPFPKQVSIFFLPFIFVVCKCFQFGKELKKGAYEKKGYSNFKLCRVSTCYTARKKNYIENILEKLRKKKQHNLILYSNNCAQVFVAW